MPLGTPSIKYLNVRRLGANVVLHGADFDEAKQECANLQASSDLTNIPPYDDPYVVAGQGTVAVEILRQTDLSTLDAIFVGVGGGGLIAGIAAYVRRVAPPQVKVIGVETRDQDAMTRSMASGSRQMLGEVGLFSDGTAVRIVGEETFRLCSEFVDKTVLVTNDEVCAAIKDVFEGNVYSLSTSSRPQLIASICCRYPICSGACGCARRCRDEEVYRGSRSGWI